MYDSNIVSFLSPKGGVGKSTLSIHAAMELSKHGRTMLVDTDPQGTAREWLSVREKECPFMVVGADKKGMLPTVLKQAHQDYDWIVIDGAGRLEGISAEIVRHSDMIVIPTQPSGPDIWAADDLVELIRQRQEITDGQPFAAFQVNGVKKGTVIGREINKIIEEMEVPQFSGVVAHRTVFATSISSGLTAQEIEPAGPGAREIAYMVKQIMEAFE